MEGRLASSLPSVRAISELTDAQCCEHQPSQNEVCIHTLVIRECGKILVCPGVGAHLEPIVECVLNSRHHLWVVYATIYNPSRMIDVRHGLNSGPLLKKKHLQLSPSARMFESWGSVRDGLTILMMPLTEEECSFGLCAFQCVNNVFPESTCEHGLSTATASNEYSQVNVRSIILCPKFIVRQ